MKLKRISWFIFGFLVLATPVYAAETITASKDNPNVVVGAQETHKNLYVAGGQVTVNGETKGDLTAAGGMVSVTGNVEQEALIAGGSLDISGSIGGTARIAGGNITISGPVGGDLVIGGGNINISGKSAVFGDLLAAGGNVIIDAPVIGNVKIAGGNITINSKISGSVQIMASKQLNFGPQAQITGSITYKGPQAATVDPSAKISQINFTQISTRGFGRSLAGLLTLAFLVKLLAWLIAAWVVVRLKKNFVIKLNEEFHLKPWENLGIGFLALFATPIAVIVLFITFVGYYLAFLLGLAYALIVVAAYLMSAIVLGYFLLSKMNKPGTAPVDWEAILIGVVVWFILGFIPFIGWLVIFVVFLMVLGAGVKVLKKSSQ